MFCRDRIRYCAALEKAGSLVETDSVSIEKSSNLTKVWKTRNTSDGEVALICNLSGRYVKFMKVAQHYTYRSVPIKWSDNLILAEFCALPEEQQIVICYQPISIPIPDSILVGQL